jgi:hypothetical protein
MATARTGRGHGTVASDPTVSRAIDRLATSPEQALRAINTARALVRARAWRLAGDHAPDRRVDAGSPLVIDVDATLLTAHSDKEGAAPIMPTSGLCRCRA